MITKQNKISAKQPVADKESHLTRNELLFGSHHDEKLVAIEHCEGDTDEVKLFFRRDGGTVAEKDVFRPWILCDKETIEGCPVEFSSQKLGGKEKIDLLASFRNWKDCYKAQKWISSSRKISSSEPGAPCVFINDPVQQYLMQSGRTLFSGMVFEELRRMQVDIECMTASGYEFCNSEREEDRIIAIALADQTGWVEVISGERMDEKAMIERFVAIVHERDPDVIEGHNIFNFDLCYLFERAKRHGVKLTLGRDGSEPSRRASRFSAGERTIAYERFDIFGRHIIDTLFLVHMYDISHRSLNGFGLKDVAVHFGVACQDRTYIEGGDISREFAVNPEKVMRYAGNDVIETREISNILSRSGFAQAQIVPYTYQNTCIRGNASKIDALMMREYLKRGQSVPPLEGGREFEGGYTDIFVQGVVENVHHCDIRSLYPSLMLVYKLGSKKDKLGVFLRLLAVLKDMRLEAKKRISECVSDTDRFYFDALQSAFKVLINSFYGYLAFSQARFSDFDAAEEVTSKGRLLLKSMISWLKEHGAVPVEIDTDGIYFVPPANAAGEGKRAGRKSGSALGEDMVGFRKKMADFLPSGIEIEFDGEYVSMYSYKMKNYALLSANGEMIIKGAALKSRGLEPFQRNFLREVIRLKLEKREKDIKVLKDSYEKAIRAGLWPIEQFAKTETLQESPSKYAAEVGRNGKSRRAVYELAVKSGREYRAGDQLSYYITGVKKNVAVHENSKLVSEWDPERRDENVAYYLEKMDSLYEKFGLADMQGELELI